MDERDPSLHPTGDAAILRHPLGGHALVIVRVILVVGVVVGAVLSVAACGSAIGCGIGLRLLIELLGDLVEGLLHGLGVCLDGLGVVALEGLLQLLDGVLDLLRICRICPLTGSWPVSARMGISCFSLFLPLQTECDTFPYLQPFDRKYMSLYQSL